MSDWNAFIVKYLVWVFGLSYRAMPSLTFTGELRSDEINTMGLGLGIAVAKR